MKIDIDIPDGVSGDWQIKTFSISKADYDFSKLRAAFKGGRGIIPIGDYKELRRAGTIVMSNTPDEIRDFSSFVHGASGRILVNGLGLGVLLKALLLKDDITEVTVIEKSKDVIKLVADSIKDKRVTIINADAFEYKPPKGKQYDCVWHDIWDYITSDNLPEMHKLHRKYGRRSNYQKSWCRDDCERAR